MGWGLMFAPARRYTVAAFPQPPAPIVVSSETTFQFFEDSEFWNEVKYGQRFPCGWDERDAKV